MGGADQSIWADIQRRELDYFGIDTVSLAYRKRFLVYC
jgi:hypothetical protein